MDWTGRITASGLHQMGSWAVGRVLSFMEMMVIDELLFISHIFSLYLLVERLTTP